MLKVKKVVFPVLGMVILFSMSSYAESVEFTRLGQMLHRYIRNGLVDYQGIQKSTELFNQALDQFQNVRDSDYKNWTRNEQEAFWINAYNITVVKTIIEHYPLQKALTWKAILYPSNSIQQIPNVWNRPALEVFGEKVSLNHIEHEILRKEFQEPRIHFALVCASLGCPVLRSEPYLADKLDLQLNDQISAFLADPKKFRYNPDADTLYLSPIFKWFKKDFEQVGGITSFLNVHLPGDVGKSISGKTKIKWLDYDWSLNERKGVT